MSCGGFAANTRPVTLVSRSTEVDQALERARHNAYERTPAALAEAERELRQLLERSPQDPLVAVARVLLARVLVAEDKLDDARRILLVTDDHADPDIPLRRELVNAVLDVRTAQRSENTRDHSALLARALARITPLIDTRPDPAETIELSCALAECVMQQPPNQAIGALARALAPVERAEINATPWVRTGLRCETVASREALIRELADRVTEASALTAAIDESREGSTLRRYLAERLLVLLADRPQETSRYMRWLADLPDDRATQRATRASLQNTVVIGVLAPMSGPQSSVATSLLRGAQLAIDTVAGPQRPNVRIVLEDEGESAAQISGAIERLFRQGARSVIGPVRAEFAPSAAIAAQSMGVSLYLLNAVAGVEQTGSLIFRAGPSVDDRATMVAAAVNQLRVTVVTSSVSELLADRLEDHLQERAIGYRRETVDGSTLSGAFANTVVVAGIFGAEARASMAERSGRARTRWVIDALAARVDRIELAEPMADLRSVGVWVGLRAGAGFAAALARYCTRSAESPDEFALMAHDAVVRTVMGPNTTAQALNGMLALDPAHALISAEVAANSRWNDRMPAAAARCERGPAQLRSTSDTQVQSMVTTSVPAGGAI